MVKLKDLKSKDNIVKSAFALFLEKGYKEVTIKNIMKATNLSKGAIYHHFASKEEIYFATLDTYYFNLLLTDELGALTGVFVHDIKHLYSYVASMFDNIENVTESGLEYPIRDFFSFQLQSEINPLIREKIYEAVLQYRELVENLVAFAIDQGQIKKDLNIEITALQIIGMIEGIAIHHSTHRIGIKEFMIKKYNQVFDEYFKLICIN
jgi:AcrR family transcriptional regulator